MNHRIIHLLTVLLAAFGFLVSMDRADGRDMLSLDGVWNFATDPDNRGETEKWYQPDVKLPAMPLPGYAPTANGTIRVPGIWDNQGYGTETDKVRHNFVGKGWYRRQVEIPQAWSGRCVFVAVTGVSRYAKVWVGEHYLGEHIGLVSPFEFDISPYVTPGKPATITIQVDSKQRWEVDSMYGAWSLADYMDIAWGGIWGHVFLEARANAWLSELFIQPSVADSSCSATAVLNGKAELADAAKLEVFDKSGQCVATATTKPGEKLAAGEKLSIQTPIANPQLWSPDSPTLYRAKLSLLKGNQSIDAVESRFGMRQFSADGPHLLLNGKRIMLCGYGDDHIYPEEMGMPSDKELHLKRLRIIKSYGFVHVRHHSTMMPPEYYDACDELGMITTSEFPIAYSAFLPGVGDTWKAKVKPGTDPGPALETYKREWEAGIKQHRNHPSILCWVRGNELYAEPLMRDEFAKIAKEQDPSRWYVDTDGTWVQDPKKDRETLPISFTQFAEWADPIDDAGKYATPPPTKPMISHETSNYLALSRPDLVDQFQHNFKPFWLTPGKEKLQKLGLTDEAMQWAEKSERLYALLQKYNLESLRKNPLISGYHWWLFQDYWTTGNGIVDHYFRPKSITTKEVLRYNNAVVLLQDGLARTYLAKTPLKVKLCVSNFAPDGLQGTLVWEVKAGDQSIVRKELAVSAVPQGELVELAQIELVLPETATPALLKVTAELQVGAKRFANDWTSWLYPADIKPADSAVPMFVEERLNKHFQNWNVKPIPDADPLPDRAVYVVDGLYEPRVIDAMNRGACVITLGGADFLTARPITYRSTWWKAGDSVSTNNTGTFVYDHPVTRAIAPDGWCDAGWFSLIEGAVKYVLETAPARPNVIVRALPSMALIEDDALLFEVGVGKGCLVVSGLNHRGAEGRPENQWLLARLLDHAAALPHPKASWPTSMLQVAFDAPEGCLPGFRRLIKNEGEQSDWYSYREDHATLFNCRQTAPGHQITWETVPVPKDQAGDRVTFVFAGSLGWKSQPKTEGFALDINGKEALRFDMPAPERWQSEDKRVELRYEQRRTVTDDSFGLFYLTVPCDMLKLGQPCLLSVRSVGTGSQRWFGLNPYLNAK